MSYRFLKFFFTFIIIGYFIGGMVSRYTPRYEYYPFFSWFLFDQIPNQKQDFTMFVVAHGDENYEPPLEFAQTAHLFRSLNQSATQYYYIIQDLGYALIGNNKAGTDEAREKLEKAFLGMPAEYQIVQVTYDPVEYWMTGTYKNQRVLATFNTK